jgi:tryptophan halogenase
LFVDASGFRSELLGKALEEPFISFDRSLFCDRAVVGGWERTTEPILPYTTAGTMERVGRGRSSTNITSIAAMSSPRNRSPMSRRPRSSGARIPRFPKDLRIVKFRSGYHQRAWVDNVLAIGNASGFVEPLEAPRSGDLPAVVALCDSMKHCLNRPTPTMQELFNELQAGTWNEIRDFLRCTTNQHAPRHSVLEDIVREDTDVGGAGPLLDFYAENGPNRSVAVTSCPNEHGLWH